MSYLASGETSSELCWFLSVFSQVFMRRELGWTNSSLGMPGAGGSGGYVAARGPNPPRPNVGVSLACSAAKY
jgi:hypothetical protein